MLTKKYVQEELARRIAGIRPNVPTNTDVLIGELKSALMLVDCLPDDQPLPEDTVLFNQGVAEGRRLESEENKDRDIVFWRGIQYAREMMMKEARNHFVHNVLSGNDMKKMIEIYNDEADCKPGDVVRVIIFKKEDAK